MSKFWIIFKREYAQVVKKKSFIIGVFAIPIIMGVFMFLPTMFARMESSDAEVMGIVDRSGFRVGEMLVEEIAAYKLKGTEDPYFKISELVELDSDDIEGFEKIDSTLKMKLADEDIDYYLVINPEPHLADTNMYLVSNSQNFTTIKRLESKLTRILSSYRLEKADIDLPTDSLLFLTNRTDLAIKSAKGETISIDQLILPAMFFVMLIYGLVFGYGQLVMRSVIEEKNSRIMEVLISSVSPFQLLLGKILGLCAVTLTQLGVWILVGVGAFMFGASAMIPPEIMETAFNPVVLVFFVLLILTGYLLYSTIFALIGSIVNSEKETQSYMFPIIMMLMIPIMISFYVMQNPHAPFNVVLSMIPMTAPTMMMMRLLVVLPFQPDDVIFSGIVIQACISIVISIFGIIGTVWVTAKVFRTGILMYGKRPTLPEIIKWVKR